MSPREGRQPLEPAPYPTAPTHTTSQTTLPSPTRLHYHHQPDAPISASLTTLSPPARRRYHTNQTTLSTTSQTTLPSPARLPYPPPTRLPCPPPARRHYRHQPDDTISADQTTLSYRPDYPIHHRLVYTTITDQTTLPAPTLPALTLPSTRLHYQHRPYHRLGYPLLALPAYDYTTPAPSAIYMSYPTLCILLPDLVLYDLYRPSSYRPSPI